MLTFDQFLIITEKKHHISQYDSWGVITPSGKKISGTEHPTARDHNQLIKAHSKESGENPQHYIQYAKLRTGPSSGMSIVRGKANAHTLSNVTKHWNKMDHHPSQQVMGEFEGPKQKHHFIMVNDHKTAKAKINSIKNSL